MAARHLLLACLCEAAHALRNQALVFLKPHAANDLCEAFVRNRLAAAGIDVLSCGKKTGQEIAERKLIDQHYGSLATLAMDTDPCDLQLQPEAKAAFLQTYGEDWEAALNSMVRNDIALETLKVDGFTLERMWRGGEQLKLAPGTYISRLKLTDKESSGPLYTINGFYPAMREAYIAPGAEVRYMVCEFAESKLSWHAFRQEVIGATDPEKAAEGSMRAEFLNRWQELGLGSAPTQAQNGVHASAGPLEGLKERCVWTGASVDTDELGTKLIGGGLDLPTLESWLSTNPTVSLGTKTGKIFDLTEEMDTPEMLQLVLPPQKPTKFDAPPPAGFIWGDTY